jgi:hypothetical protein
MLAKHPYQHSSDDVIFETSAARRALKPGVAPKVLIATRAEFFSTGRACLRASPLTKLHGWGVHPNSSGRIAIFGVESEEYRRLAANPTIKHVSAMRARRAS